MPEKSDAVSSAVAHHPAHRTSAPRIILASRSPRRQELLREMRIPFEVIESGIEESEIQADHPRTFALRAAYAKGHDVAARIEPPALVIAADTVVTHRLKLFGKPASPDEARAMLRELSGNTHLVITALAILEAGKTTALLDSAETRVTFHLLDGRTIEDYLATGEPFDKAGAYGIQGHAGRFVASIEGDYHNVVGLPCALLLQLLGQFMDTRKFCLPAVRWSPAPHNPMLVRET